MEQVQPIAFGVSCLHSQISIDNPFLSVSFMERLRLVGSLKVQISFAKEPYKRDDILQKRPIIWARGGEVHRAEAAARHQGRSK